MYDVFYSVLPIFLIALLGSVIKRKWLTSDEFWRGLEKLSFYILFPMVLFQYSSQIDLESSECAQLTISLVISTLLVSIALVIYQYKSEKYTPLQFTSIFQGATRYNSYIFFALGAALFGDEGLTIVSAISPYLLILTNIASVSVFVLFLPKEDGLTKTQTFILTTKSSITNPFIIASITGGIFNYCGLSLNIGVEKTIQHLASSALTIGMLIVGSGIKFDLNSKYFQQIWFTSVVKLILTPIVTFIILSIFDITGIAKSVGILFSCLPCATSSYILSKQLGGDPDTMSSTITFTTIFSIFSLSLLVYILG